MNTCEICGIAFHVKPSREKKCHARFCSWECFKTKKTKKCEVCGKKYKVQRWEDKIRKHCSRKCYAKAQKKRPGYWLGKKRPGLKLPHFYKVGEHCGADHPLWKGGITDQRNRDRNLLEIRRWKKKIFERDDYTCKICGKRGGRLVADHYPYPFYKYPEKRTKLSNGRTLCRECNYHVTYELKEWANA